jgi:DMSO/TMAO reductase YedYZ heme-binding membrane subunit
MSVAMPKTSLLNNSRFYILVTSFLLSLAIIGLLRLQIPSDQLFYIRTQQMFGLLGVVYWYFALIISPIGYVIGKQRVKKLEFTRRAIGVSAFYFVLLHGVIASWGQLGGLSELQYLPTLFKWSLAGGGIAFAILLIMALTSFDKVVKFMTYRKWKWLHRLVYIGGILALLHIWTVGTHLAYDGVQVAAFIALVILSGLELYRTTKLLNDKYLHLDKAEAVTFYVASWAIVSTLILMTPVFVQNYHSRHSDHKSTTTSEAHQ